MLNIQIATNEDEIAFSEKYKKSLGDLGFTFDERHNSFKAELNSKCFALWSGGVFCMGEEEVHVKIRMGGEITIWASDFELDWCRDIMHKAIDAIGRESNFDG